MEKYVKENRNLCAALGGGLLASLLAGWFVFGRSRDNEDDEEVRTQYVVEQLGERFVRATLFTWNLSEETVLTNRILGEDKLKPFSAFVKKYDIGSFNLPSAGNSLVLKRLKKILGETHELISVKECKAVLFVRSSLFEVVETGFAYLGKHTPQRFIWARLRVCGMVTSFMIAGVNLSKEGCQYEETTNNNPRHQEVRDLITSINDVKTDKEPIIITGAFRAPYPVIQNLAPDYINTFQTLGQSCPSNFPSTHHTGPSQISQFIFMNRFCEPLSTETLRNMGDFSAHEPVCATFNVDVDYDRKQLKEHLEMLVRGNRGQITKKAVEITGEDTPGGPVNTYDAIGSGSSV